MTMKNGKMMDGFQATYATHLLLAFSTAIFCRVVQEDYNTNYKIEM